MDLFRNKMYKNDTNRNIKVTGGSFGAVNEQRHTRFGGISLNLVMFQRQAFNPATVNATSLRSTDVILTIFVQSTSSLYFENISSCS